MQRFHKNLIENSINIQINDLRKKLMKFGIGIVV